MRLRQGVIWVMAFLVAPGLSITFRFGTHDQFALYFAPERADGLLLMMMILFVSYSAVAIGLIAARPSLRIGETPRRRRRGRRARRRR